MATKAAPGKPANQIDPKLLKNLIAKIENVGQIKVVNIDSVKEDPKNARTHDERNIKELTRSIRQFGQVSPIIVDKKGMVLKGHGVRRAMKALGIPKIQIKIVPFEGNLARAYALTDNRTGELSSFDQQVLAGVMKDIMADGDLVKFLEGEVPGFTGAEQANIISLLEADGELSFEGGGADDVALIDGDEEANADSHVRMAQLFLDNKTFPEFLKMTEKIAEHLGTENLTDTVFTLVKQAYGKLVPAKPATKKK